MRTVFHSGGFRKDLRLMHRRGKDLTRLQAVLDCLAEGVLRLERTGTHSDLFG